MNIFRNTCFQFFEEILETKASRFTLRMALKNNGMSITIVNLFGICISLRLEDPNGAHCKRDHPVQYLEVIYLSIMGVFIIKNRKRKLTSFIYNC